MGKNSSEVLLWGKGRGRYEIPAPRAFTTQTQITAIFGIHHLSYILSSMSEKYDYNLSSKVKQNHHILVSESYLTS